MKKIMRDDTEHGKEYYLASEVDALLAKQALIQRAEEAFEASQQEQGAPVAWAEEIIEDFHALYNSEMIKENDSGDELIRLDAAVCAVEEAAQRHTTTPQPKQEQGVPEVGFGNIKQEQGKPVADLSRLKPENAQQVREWIADGSFVQRAIDTMFELSQEITALKQEQGEPVAWMVWGDNNVPSLTFTKPADKYVFDALCRRLFPLTDEQIKDVANSCMWWVREQDILDDAIEFARAIEAAHGIKENI
jgi:hypothetical protein